MEPADSAGSATAAPSQSKHSRVLIGLVIGAAAGVAANFTLGGDNRGLQWVLAHITEPIGALFLRLLMMIVIPLVVTSLILGIARIGDIRKLGRIGLRCFAYCIVLSAISVGIGLFLANTIQPGKKIDEATAKRLQERYGEEAQREIQKATQTVKK